MPASRKQRFATTRAPRRFHAGASWWECHFPPPHAEATQVPLAAATDAPGVLATPPPFVRTKSFGESAIEYELLFFVDDFEHAHNIDGAVRDRVYYALARRGVEIPFPTRT